MKVKYANHKGIGKEQKRCRKEEEGAAHSELLDALAAYGNGALVALNKFITADITGRTNNRP